MLYYFHEHVSQESLHRRRTAARALTPRAFHICFDEGPMKTHRTMPDRLAALAMSAAVFATIIATTLASPPVHADEVDNVTALLETKRYDAALTTASAYVRKHPRDPQMRFLQGVSLASLGRSSDAIAVFTSLTADFPDLAEPYNNLAVLHAAAQDYASARIALERAIHADPGFTTAHENLGNLYLQLASQAYGKVVQLAPDHAGARQRQSLLANINALPLEAPLPATGRIAMASARLSDRETVLATVKEWTEAWSGRDATAYLEHYSADFRTPDRQSRREWEKSRRSRIEGKSRIEVVADSPEVSVREHIATVTFRQIYVSDSYTSKERKTLVFRKEGKDWKIIDERSGG